MKVKDLIADLEQYDPESEVVIITSIRLLFNGRLQVVTDAPMANAHDHHGVVVNGFGMQSRLEQAGYFERENTSS